MPDPLAAPGLIAGAWKSRRSIAAVARLTLAGPFGRPATDPVDLAAVPPSREGPFRPDADRLRRLVAALEGSVADFERPGGALLLPPTAFVTWLTPVMSRALLAAGISLPTARVLHAGNEVRFARVPSVDEALTVEARLASVDATPARTLVVERAVHRDAAGAEVFTVDTTLFFPGPGPKEKPTPEQRAAREAEKAREKAEAPRVPEGAREVGRLRAGMAASRAYTAISGDYNPVHISWIAARLLGFRGPFVHGYATKGRIGVRLVRHLLGGDASRLARLSVRFRRTIALDEETALFASGPGVPREGAATGPGRCDIAVGTAVGDVSYVTGEAEWR